jgi:predicted phage terminase large subunit-like protein
MTAASLAKRTLQRGIQANLGYRDSLAQAQRGALRQRQNAKPVSHESFREFILRVMPEYEFYEWNSVAIDLLQQVTDGTLHRLIITLPPQHGKTLLASRLFPAYFLHRFSRRYVGITTYDGGISYGISREARRYYRLAGGVLAPDSANVGMWNTIDNGGLWAAGVGGAVTSRPAHLLVGDDWLKGQREADSRAVREDAHTFYSPTWRSRLQKDGAILLIGTRWHHMDLMGYVLKMEEESGNPEHWTIVDFPAIAEPHHERPEYPATCRVVPGTREPGEVLCPERFDEKELNSLKASMQPRHWDALYQCRPSSVEGTIFRREWLNWYDQKKPLPRFWRTIISLDAAFKDRETSDYVAFTVWGQIDRDFWLLDAVNERMDFQRTITVLLSLAARWRPSASLIEDAANGPAIISALKARFPNLVAVTPDGNKEARAFATQPIFVRGSVIFPLEAPWLATVLGQVLPFPTGEGRDLVDSTTQALRFLDSIQVAQQSPTSWGLGSPDPPTMAPPLNWSWASGPNAGVNPDASATPSSRKKPATGWSGRGGFG